MNDLDLFRLVYISSATTLPDQATLDEILIESRRNNQCDGITGLLLYHDGNFFQTLEGSAGKVLACYDRIVADRRHRGCIRLLADSADARLFADWEMGFIPFAELSTARRKGFFDLQSLRRSPRMEAFERDPDVSLFVNNFLSSFRDL